MVRESARKWHRSRYLWGMCDEYPYTVENTTEPDGCPFCAEEVIAQQTLHECPNFRLIYCLTPAVDGNLLLVPKRHLLRFEELTVRELAALHDYFQWIPGLFSSLYQADDYFILQKNGTNAGQTVAHIHFHLIPMKSGDIDKFSRAFDYRRMLTPQEMEQEVARARGAISTLLEQQPVL